MLKTPVTICLLLIVFTSFPTDNPAYAYDDDAAFMAEMNEFLQPPDELDTNLNPASTPDIISETLNTSPDTPAVPGYPPVTSISIDFFSIIMIILFLTGVFILSRKFIKRTNTPPPCQFNVASAVQLSLKIIISVLHAVHLPLTRNQNRLIKIQICPFVRPADIRCNRIFFFVQTVEKNYDTFLFAEKNTVSSGLFYAGQPY